MHDLQDFPQPLKLLSTERIPRAGCGILFIIYISLNKFEKSKLLQWQQLPPLEAWDPQPKVRNDHHAAKPLRVAQRELAILFLII